MPEAHRREQAGGLVSGELLEEASLGQFALQQDRVGEFGRQRRGGSLGSAPAREEGQGAPACRLEQESQLLVQRLLGALAAPVGEVPCHVEQRVGAVVEGAADVELLARKALEPDALDEVRRDGRAGQDGRDLAPEHAGERRPDVDGGEAESDVAPCAVDPGHLAIGADDQAVQVLRQVRGRLQRPGLAARAVGVGVAPRTAAVVGQERTLRAAPA